MPGLRIASAGHVRSAISPVVVAQSAHPFQRTRSQPSSRFNSNREKTLARGSSSLRRVSCEIGRAPRAFRFPEQQKSHSPVMSERSVCPARDRSIQDGELDFYTTQWPDLTRFLFGRLTNARCPRFRTGFIMERMVSRRLLSWIG
jgi:hypothetical protein